VKAFRRAALALLVASIFGALVRLRGTGGKPPKGPGWQEVPSTDTTK